MAEGGLGRIRWQGTVPGGDSNVYLLWATTNPAGTQTDASTQNANRDGGCGACLFQNTHTDKIVLSLNNSQAGTLNEYYSVDRGANWRQVSTEAIVIPTAGFTTEREFLVETYPDWKLEWVNGGVAQSAAWSPTLAGVDQRAIP